MSRTRITPLLLCALAWTIALQAQSYYGSVRGTIFDQNGGVLASGKVSLINQGTSEQRSTISSGSGEFVFSEVVPGTYSLVAESPGFKKFDRKNVVIGTQQQVSCRGWSLGRVDPAIGLRILGLFDCRPTNTSYLGTTAIIVWIAGCGVPCIRMRSWAESFSRSRPVLEISDSSSLLPHYPYPPHQRSNQTLATVVS